MYNRESSYTGAFQIGQRVRCSLHYFGLGTVVAVTGGKNELDIVWDNGQRSSVPESLARSNVQWTVLEEVVSAQDVADALAMAEATKREKEEAQARKARTQAEEKASLIDNPDFAGLKRADQCDDYSAKVAAANLRKLLKKEFPGIKFSVRMGSGSSSVRVTWTDGPLEDDVNGIAQRFKRGSFNSMEDIYEYNRSAFCELFGGADYVSCKREMSNTLVAKAIDLVWTKYAANVQGIEKPTPEGIASGRFSLIEVPGIHEPVARLVRSQAAQMAA